MVLSIFAISLTGVSAQDDFNATIDNIDDVSIDGSSVGDVFVGGSSVGGASVGDVSIDYIDVNNTENDIGSINISNYNRNSTSKNSLSMSYDNELLTATPSGQTFTAIQNAINSMSSGTLYLSGTYTGSSIITVSKGITIEGTGSGAILDAGGHAGIMNITASGVTLKNIWFINSKGAGSKGAALTIQKDLATTVHNCTFINNSANGKESAGAIYNQGNSEITKCTFINNTCSVEEGAGAFFADSSGDILKINFCIFMNNTKNGVRHDIWNNSEGGNFDCNYWGKNFNSISQLHSSGFATDKKKNQNYIGYYTNMNNNSGVITFYCSKGNDVTSKMPEWFTTSSTVTTTTTVSLSSNSVSYDNSITVSSTVKAGSSTLGSSAGTVSYYYGNGNLIGTANIGSSVTFKPSSITIYKIYAVFDGNSNYASSTSSNQTLTVSKASTSTTVSLSNDHIYKGDSITVSSTVKAGSSTLGSSAGTVSYYYGNGILIDTVNVGNSVSFKPSSSGTYGIYAVYNGNSYYYSSTSSNQTLTVNDLVSTDLSLRINTGNGNTTGSSFSSVSVDEYGYVTLIPTLSTGGNKFVIYRSYNGASYSKVFNGTLSNGYYSTSLANGGTYKFYFVFEGNSTHGYCESTEVTAIVKKTIDFKLRVNPGSNNQTSPAGTEVSVVAYDRVSFLEYFNDALNTPKTAYKIYINGSFSSECNLTGVWYPEMTQIGKFIYYMVFEGNSTHSAATSNEVTIYVAAKTTTTVRLNSSSISLGNKVRIEPVVSYNGGTVNEGQVEIYYNDTKISTIDAGSYYDFQAPSIADYNIWVKYIGNQYYGSSVSANYPLTVSAKEKDGTNLRIDAPSAYSKYTSKNPYVINISLTDGHGINLDNVDVSVRIADVNNASNLYEDTVHISNGVGTLTGFNPYKNGAKNYKYNVSAKFDATSEYKGSSYDTLSKIYLEPFIFSDTTDELTREYGQLVPLSYDVTVVNNQYDLVNYNGEVKIILIPVDDLTNPFDLNNYVGTIYNVSTNNGHGDLNLVSSTYPDKLDVGEYFIGYFIDLSNIISDYNISYYSSWGFLNITQTSSSLDLNISGDDYNYGLSTEVSFGEEVYLRSHLNVISTNNQYVLYVSTDAINWISSNPVWSDDKLSFNAPMGIGTYYYKIGFTGDDNYLPVNSSYVTLTVGNRNLDISITAESIYYEDDAIINISVKDNLGIPVGGISLNLLIDGETYSFTTDANGFKTYTIPKQFAAKTSYDLEVNYNDGSPYNDSSKTSSLTVYRLATNIGSNTFTTTTLSGESMSFNLKDSKGKSLANKLVNISFDNQDYILKTDSNGNVSIPINVLNKGTYPITASFAGDENYSATHGVFDIIVNPKPVVIEVSNVVYSKSADQYLLATIKSDGVALANKKLDFYLNGVVYSDTSDENGLVKIALNLSVKKTYQVSVRFDGDDTYLYAFNKYTLKITN